MINNEMKIDLLGQYYTAINNEHNPGVFAISVHLKEEINPQLLQTALDDLMRRLPFFKSKVNNGFFHYKLKEIANFPQIELEGKSPLFDDYYNHGEGHLIKVVFGPKYFIVKATHSICDGRGLSKFTVALLSRYFELKGVKINKKNIIDCEEEYRSIESEDAVNIYISKPNDSKEKEEKLDRVYQVPILNSEEQYTISECFDAILLKQKSKEQGVSISQYLLNIIFEVIKNKRDSEKQEGHITGSLQVDCRNFFPSETLRSFVTAKNIVMPESADVDENKRQLKQQFQKINKMYIQNKLYEQKRAFSLVRYVPRIIKDRFMRMISRMDASETTTGLSNLGVVQLPKEIASYVEYFEFPIAIEEGISQFFSCVTVGSKLTLTATFYEEGRLIVEEVMARLKNNKG